MDERRLIKSGPGSYTVTVPIAWVRKNKLRRGAPVHVQETAFNTVVLSAKPQLGASERRTVVVDAQGKDKDALVNQLIAAYLNSADAITIARPSRGLRESLRVWIGALIGLSVVEETPGRMEIHDLLDLSKIDIKSTVRRIDMMTRSLFSELAGGADDAEDASDATARQILGQSFLVHRILRLAARDPAMLEQAGMPVAEVLDTIRLVIALEDSADRLRRLIRLLHAAPGGERTRIRDLSSSLEGNYRDAIEAYFRVDRERGMRVMEGKGVLRAHMELALKAGLSLPVYNELISLEKSIRQIALVANDRWIPESGRGAPRGSLAKGSRKKTAD